VQEEIAKNTKATVDGIGKVEKAIILLGAPQEFSIP
jgi:hypothetical protein